jgi:hypothetical protein
MPRIRLLREAAKNRGKAVQFVNQLLAEKEEEVEEGLEENIARKKKYPIKTGRTGAFHPVLFEWLCHFHHSTQVRQPTQ